ncbi:MAG: Fic/DOC family N-terminal domain-containing protein [Aliidongia sp.]
MRRDDLSHDVRQRLTRYGSPFDAHYGVVPAPPPEHVVSTMEIRACCEAAERALAVIETLASNLPDPWLVSRILLRREAVSSSAMENTNATLDELLSVEEGGAPDASSTALQVRDYALALDELIPEARRCGPAMFTVDLVARLHAAAMRGDGNYLDSPGNLRTSVVWIGGKGDIAYSTFNPQPPGDVRPCLEQTMAYLRCEGMQTMHQSLLTRMAIAHAHFEAVHPFRDGNGRVGRLLLPLMMAAEGTVPLFLSPYIEANRDAYYAALKAAQQRLEWPAIIGFMADAVVGTVAELLATRSALDQLGRIWRTRRKFRNGSAALRALDHLSHYPVVTVTRLTKILDITFPAAAAAVNQLTETGILTERTGYRAHRISVAREALSIINRPFGEEPILP